MPTQSFTTSIELDWCLGYITEVLNPAPGPRGSHEYRGIIQTRHGKNANVPIGPSSVDGFDLPQHVRPLNRGKAIHGVMVNGEAQWLYNEVPKIGICGPGIGGGSAASPLLYLTKDQLRTLKRMLAEVE